MSMQETFAEANNYVQTIGLIIDRINVSEKLIRNMLDWASLTLDNYIVHENLILICGNGGPRAIIGCLDRKGNQRTRTDNKGNKEYTYNEFPDSLSTLQRGHAKITVDDIFRAGVHLDRFLEIVLMAIKERLLQYMKNGIERIKDSAVEDLICASD